MEILKMRRQLLGYCLHRVDSMVLRRHTAVLRPYGVSFQAATMLVFIRDASAKGPVNQRAAQDYSGLTNPAVTKVVRALEQEGLITREEDPQDGRSRLLKPTPLGLERAELFGRLIAETDKACFSKLSQEERILLKSIVDKIQE